MLYLKKINFEDVEEEYKAIKSMPAQENGFENKYHDVTKEEFINEVIPNLLKISEGLDLRDGYVPDTYFFLWDDDKIVGLFKIRHYLNDFLRKGAGHIGYGILPEYRGKGYAKKGLVLAIEKCKEIAKETGGSIEMTEDVMEASKGADVIYTDVWVSMGEPDEVWAERIKLLSPYQVDMNVMNNANDNAIFLHCLPSFHDLNTSIGKDIYEKFGLKEMEVTDEVFNSSKSKVFDEAENRLHTIKAVVYATMRDE